MRVRARPGRPARRGGGPCARSGASGRASASRWRCPRPRRHPASHGRRPPTGARRDGRPAGTASIRRRGGGCPCCRRARRAGSWTAAPSSAPRRSRRRTARPGSGCRARTPPGRPRPRGASPCRTGSGKSSARRPKPGIEAVQPQSAGSNSSRSIWSVSPGSAPSTATGPVTWSTRSKSSVARSAFVDSAFSWPKRGVEAVELDDLARPDRRHRLDGRVPDEVVLVARDVERRLGKGPSAHSTSTRHPSRDRARRDGPGGEDERRRADAVRVRGAARTVRRHRSRAPAWIDPSTGPTTAASPTGAHRDRGES